MPPRKIRRSPLSQFTGSEEGGLEDSFSESSNFSTQSRGSTFSSSSTRRRNYHVKFDLKHTVKHSSPPLEDKEVKRMWYTSKDTDKMKEFCFAKGREYGKEDKKSRGSNNLHALLGKLLEACLKAKEDTGKPLLKKKDMVKLAECLSGAPERVGLESAINTDLMANKLNTRYTILRKVICEHGDNGGCVLDMFNGPVDDKELARASEKYSLASRLLARHLAQAVAAGVRQ
mmetsp:Transcript_14938/g.28535  ORF Transcript_14938/g.28535 Transcript_14938/m.28535 type:complete len:230 (-) Transcript_14938:84-773(-)|eukprot:scaffold1328_cov162-Amphora_coffeaeformis.AAC.31